MAGDRNEGQGIGPEWIPSEAERMARDVKAEHRRALEWIPHGKDWNGKECTAEEWIPQGLECEA